MGPILAALDFSDATPGVMNTASDLARAFQVKLYLLHVAGPRPNLADPGPNIQNSRQSLAEIFRREHRELHTRAEQIKATGIPVTPLLIQGGASEKILQETRRLDASLAVLGTHGHSRLYNLLMGSVSREVLQNASCPVVLVPYQLKTLG